MNRSLYVAAALALAGPIFPPISRAEPTLGGIALLRELERGFVEVFEKVAPCVVVVEAVQAENEMQAESDQALEEIFGDDSDEEPPAGKRERLFPLPKPRNSEGSGFLIGADGFIATNGHVIAGADKILVRLRDGRRLPANVRGVDERTDVAVLKVEAGALPVVTWGDSDAVRVGQFVGAIGAPYRQSWSFTAGWVSGKGRHELLATANSPLLYEDYLQTDTLINPGNSGGPLFDLDGRVVGMNTLINTRERGLAFAIPSAILRDVTAQLVATGKVRRAWLGVTLRGLDTHPLRESFAGQTAGVVVDTLHARSPALNSELRPGDLVLSADGQKVVSATDLQRIVLRKKPGDSLALRVWRGGDVSEISVPTGELPDALTAKGEKPKPAAIVHADFGLTLEDAQPTGARVAAVVRESAAEKSGLRAGDIIQEIDRRPSPNAARAREILQGNKPGGSLRVRFQRAGQHSWAVLE